MNAGEGEKRTTDRRVRRAPNKAILLCVSESSGPCILFINLNLPKMLPTSERYSMRFVCVSLSFRLLKYCLLLSATVLVLYGFVSPVGLGLCLQSVRVCVSTLIFYN